MQHAGRWSLGNNSENDGLGNEIIVESTVLCRLFPDAQKHLRCFQVHETSYWSCTSKHAKNQTWKRILLRNLLSWSQDWLKRIFQNRRIPWNSSNKHGSGNRRISSTVISHFHGWVMANSNHQCINWSLDRQPGNFFAKAPNHTLEPWSTPM